jgi:hypothetical protein
VLDIGRVGVLLVAIVLALRHRFVAGAILGMVLLGAFVEMGVLGAVALARGAIGGEYAVAFVFIGPTAAPYGGLEWLPCAVQWALAGVAAVPAFVALRRQLTVGEMSDEAERWRGVGGWFLFLFSTSACLAVTSAMTTFLVWSQSH